MLSFFEPPAILTSSSRREEEEELSDAGTDDTGDERGPVSDGGRRAGEDAEIHDLLSRAPPHPLPPPLPFPRTGEEEDPRSAETNRSLNGEEEDLREPCRGDAMGEPMEFKAREKDPCQEVVVGEGWWWWWWWWWWQSNS